MKEPGEPISRGRIDKRAADALAMRNVVYAVLLIMATVLTNGVLAILGIEALQAIGAWPEPAVALDRS